MKRVALAAGAVLLCAGVLALLLSDDEAPVAPAVPAAPAPPPVLAEAPPPPAVEQEPEREAGEDDALFGVVLDAEGKPAAGADVVVTRVAADLLGLPECATEEDDDGLCLCGPLAQKLVAALERLPAQSPELARTRTDAEGRFRIAPAPRAPDHRVTASLGAFRASDRAVVGEELELELSAPVRRRVYVFDDQYVPVAGATVLLLDEPPQRTVTDARGLADVTHLKGEVELFAFAAGRLPGSLWFRGDELDDDALQLRLSTSRRVAGRVVRDGAPVAGAEVTLDADDCAFSAVTGARGGFSFENVPADEHLVAARAGHEAGVARAEVSKKDQLELVVPLGSASSVAGRVVDEDTGEPIADADVSLLPGTADELDTSTADDGTFRFDVVGVGLAELHVTKEGYAAGRRALSVGANAVTGLDVELGRGAVLAGVVVDGARRPVARALLVSGEVETVTDAAGAFTLHLAEGSHPLTVTSDAHVAWHGELVAPKRGVEIVLSAGGTLEGDVLDGRGIPAAGVQVRCDRKRGGSTEPGSRPLHGVTDRLGRFRLTGLAPGAWRVKAVAEGAATEAAVTVRADELQRVTLAFPPVTRLEGRVVDGSGQPVAAARLFATCTGARAVSDTAGRFTLEKVPLGPCEVGLGGERYLGSRVEVVVTARTPPVTVVAKRVAVLRGRAVDEAGAPVERLRVDIGQGYRGLVSPDGYFETMAYGSTSLTISAEGTLPVKLPSVASDGPDVELGTLVLRSGRQVAATVRDGEGVPIAGAEFTMGSRSPGRSGRDGAALLRGLPPEPVELRVQHPHFQTARVTVGAAQEAVDVVLLGGAVLRGTLVGADAPEEYSVHTGGHWSLVDAEGHFMLAGLEPGVVTVNAHHRGHSAQYVPSVKATVSLSAETHVELHVTPRTGDVVLVYPTPQSGMALTVDVQSGSTSGQVRAEWGGNGSECRLRGLPAGPVTLKVWRGTEWASVAVTVVEGQLTRHALQ